MKIDVLLDRLENERVSWSLAKALRIAERVQDKPFINWCRLELGGYWASNPIMTEDIVVPEYRTVPGQHTDIYGRALKVESDLAFVNETRLRNGVEELECLADSREMVSMHDANMCELLKEHLEVDVYAFRFSAVHIRGILAAIRGELSDRLHALQSNPGLYELSSASSENEIIELRPNIWGVGVDLRALWRKWKGKKS